MSSASVNLQPSQPSQQQHPSATSSSSSAPTVAVKRSLNNQHCSAGSPASCQLADAELWRRFHEVGNEMIVTKAGRRMFPVIAVSINGLDPDALYSICVEFHPADDNRYKYVGGQWVIAAKSQLHDVPVPTYWHPEIPNFGSHWMNNLVSFGKLKLTNKDKLDKSQVSLVTLHLYQPVIRVIRVAGQQERFTVATFTFPETRFMAVTSYQNEDVTSLKVRYNPFAQKVFQDMAKGRSGGGGSTSNGGQDDDGDDDGQMSPPVVNEPRPSASTTTKMMKAASGVAIATSTASMSYNNRSQPPQQVSPPQQAPQSSQQPHRPVPCQPNLLIDSNMMGSTAGMGMAPVQDFQTFIGAGLQQPPRYGAFTPVQQPMFDQFGQVANDTFQFSSMYGNPAAFTNAYHNPNQVAMAQTTGPCFANGPMSSGLPPTTTSAAAAAAAYASYSSSLLSSSLPPVAHSTNNAAAAAFWPGFNLYPTGPATSGAVAVPTFHPSTLSMLTKSTDIISSVTSASSTTPSTPSGPNSNNNSNGNNASGGRTSGSISLMRLGATNSGNNNNNPNANNSSSNGNNNSSSATTPILQQLTGRSSDMSGSTSSSTGSSGVLKASPPESGYCGSPPGDEWAACAYQQLNRPGSTNNSSATNGPVITSLTSASSANAANSAAY